MWLNVHCEKKKKNSFGEFLNVVSVYMNISRRCSFKRLWNLRWPRLLGYCRVFLTRQPKEAREDWGIEEADTQSRNCRKCRRNNFTELAVSIHKRHVTAIQSRSIPLSLLSRVLLGLFCQTSVPADTLSLRDSVLSSAHVVILPLLCSWVDCCVSSLSLYFLPIK